ncbi:hypothetical protein [Conexibacter sp. CPCC 206217]|uniref:hypothetical protein n=1 Tax=Conexibacter sp. CPCC 206217 TaxID=3064574 RepID=UPI002720AC60|nr:hypothetical protein [Conexibacter sp. CPCC 206217]MDO8211959.1 hypothetical protein [Conexibacter sp. CPCC 206217]
MRSRYGWHGRLAVATAALATFAVAVPANAATTSVRLSGGSTTLRLDGKTARALTSAGITVKPSKPGKNRGGALVLPVSGGSIDPANAKGTIDHKGGITLSMGRTKVALTAFTLNTGKKTVSAKAGRSTLAVGSLSGGKVTRDGFATKVAGLKLKLGKQAAGVLNRAFGVRVFKSGLALGTAASAPVSRDVAIDRGTTTLQINAQTAGALRQFGATLAPIAPATADAATGQLFFPITGGTVNPTAFSGSITHSGGLNIGPLPLSDLVVNLGATPTLTTNLGAVADLDLSRITTSVDPRTRAINVGGAGVRINATAAGALNAAFRTTAFQAGQEIATASLAAIAR